MQFTVRLEQSLCTASPTDEGWITTTKLVYFAHVNIGLEEGDYPALFTAYLNLDQAEELLLPLVNCLVQI